MMKRIFNKKYDTVCKQIQRAERYIEWGLYDQAIVILDYVEVLQKGLDIIANLYG